MKVIIINANQQLKTAVGNYSANGTAHSVHALT